MKSVVNILEIGAGVGVFSCAMKEINKGFNLGWISHGEPSESRSFNFIKQNYPEYEYNNYFELSKTLNLILIINPIIMTIS